MVHSHDFLLVRSGNLSLYIVYAITQLPCIQCLLAWHTTKALSANQNYVSVISGTDLHPLLQLDAFTYYLILSFKHHIDVQDVLLMVSSNQTHISRDHTHVCMGTV